MKLRRKSRWLPLVLAFILGCDPGYSSGDRVLVAKDDYDAGIGGPRRLDVVVFKYPETPVDLGIPKNFIKRLIGLPGEIIAIFFGQLFVFTPDKGSPPLFDDASDKEVTPGELWKPQFMHIDSPKLETWFREAGKFSILRKPPQVMLDMRRLVYDNDHQAQDLKGVLAPRWQIEQIGNKGSGWEVAKDTEFKHAGDKKDDAEWLRYHHLVRPPKGQPFDSVKDQLITDFMSYNSPILLDPRDKRPIMQKHDWNWVGDLMVEFQLEVIKPEGEVWVELRRGIYHYQARFDLATGMCSLYRVHEGKATLMEIDGKVGTAETRAKGPGTYEIRLANFDARLTLWVDGEYPFGDGFEFPPPEIRGKEEELSDAEKRRGPRESDLQPAGIASKGAAVNISHLRVWRNSYYTLAGQEPDAFDHNFPPHDFSWSEPKTWESLCNLKFKTMYVQPGHYLCMGDNSPQSDDSRRWGTVPHRLLLGRALVVYWPPGRMGPIR